MVLALKAVRVVQFWNIQQVQNKYKTVLILLSFEIFMANNNRMLISEKKYYVSWDNLSYFSQIIINKLCTSRYY